MWKKYPGSPAITYENSNEELGEDVILIEKGNIVRAMQQHNSALP